MVYSHTVPVLLLTVGTGVEIYKNARAWKGAEPKI